MDFKSFKKQYDPPCDKCASRKEELQKTAEEYAKMDDNSLLNEIMKTANKGKSEGSFSSEQLKQFAANVSPMLNAEQRARLNSVIEMINKS